MVSPIKVVPIRFAKDEVSVNGKQVKVIYGYSQHVEDAALDFFRPNKRARKKWIVDQQVALEHFNQVANFNSSLRSKKIADNIAAVTELHNKLAAELKSLIINVRKKIYPDADSQQQAEDKFTADFLKVDFDIKLIAGIVREDLPKIERVRKRCLLLQKQIESLTKQKELVQQQEQQALQVTVVDGDGKLPTRDDAYLDPFVFDGQVESKYAHRYNGLYSGCSNSEIEFAIDHIYPDFECFIAEQKEFLASQQPNYISRAIRNTFGIFTGTLDFIDRHQTFIARKENEILFGKQALAQTAYDRLNKEMINGSFNVEKFKKFADFVKANGNFTVINVERADIDELLKFVEKEQKQNQKQRNNVIYRLFFGDSKEYIQRREYLKSLKKDVVKYKRDLRAMQGQGVSENEEKFNTLLEIFNANKSDNEKINRDNLAKKKNAAAFITFIRDQKNEVEKQKYPQGIKGFFKRLFRAQEVVEAENQLEYLQQLELALNREHIQEEYKADVAIKLTVDTQANPYSRAFFERYNEQRARSGKNKLQPNGLMQLVNEVVEYSEADNFDQFKMLLEKYNQFCRQNVQGDQASVIALDNIDTDASVRMAALEKLQANSEQFKKFLAKYFEENKQSENLTGRDRLFFHYLKRFQGEFEKPFRSLAEKLGDRINNAYTNLIELFICHGVNDKLIATASGYINLICYGVEADQFDVTSLPQLKDKNAAEAKAEFLKALSLVQAIVEGKFSSDHPQIQQLSELCQLVLTQEQLRSAGSYSSEKHLIERFTTHHFRKQLNKQCRQVASAQGADQYIALIDHYTELNYDKQYKDVAADALIYFNHLFLANPLVNDPYVITIGAEHKLSNNPLTYDDDRDLEIISNSPAKKRAEQGFKIGDIWFDKTLQEVARQQNRVALFSDFNAKKIELIDRYLEKYDGKNNVYAEVITIAGTAEQIQKYAEKLLSKIFTQDKISLSLVVSAFIKTNYDIIKNVIDQVIDNYISGSFKFDVDTQATIDAIGSLDNRQRYVNKRVNELLVKGMDSDGCVIPKDVQECVEYLNQNPDFTYPDFDNSKPSTIEELLQCFKRYSEDGAWNVSADFLAARFFTEKHQQILQDLRINKINNLLNVALAVNDDDERRLSSVREFIRYLDKKPPIDAVLLEESIKEAGKQRIDEAFRKFFDANQDWHQFAEEIACAFDRDGEWLQNLRLRRVREIVEANDLNVANSYIQYVKKSDIKLLAAVAADKHVAGEQKLDTIFKESIYANDGNPLNPYVWSETTEILVREWGTAERLDSCLIARMAYLLDQQDILATEKYILDIQSKGFEKGGLVKTLAGQSELINLLKRYAERSSWHPNIELLIEYFEPVGNNKELLFNYRLKRITEIMESKGERLGCYDFPEDVRTQLFAQKEYQRYQNLKASNGSTADFNKLKDYFGETCLLEFRKLMTRYVDSFANKNYQGVNTVDTTTYDLCVLLLSESLANERINNVKGDASLYKKWVQIVKQHAYLQEIGRKIAGVMSALKFGDYEGAKDTYEGNVARGDVYAAVSNQKESHTNARKIIDGIELRAIEVIREMVAYYAQISIVTQQICAAVSVEQAVSNLQTLQKALPELTTRSYRLVIEKLLQSTSDDQQQQAIQAILNHDEANSAQQRFTDIHDQFISHMKSESAKALAIFVKDKCDDINEAYKAVNVVLDELAHGKAYSFDLSENAIELLAKGLNRERKVQLLSRLNALVSGYENIQGNPLLTRLNNTLKLIVDAVESGMVDEQQKQDLASYQRFAKEYEVYVSLVKQSADALKNYTKLDGAFYAAVRFVAENGSPTDRQELAEQFENIKKQQTVTTALCQSIVESLQTRSPALNLAARLEQYSQYVSLVEKVDSFINGAKQDPITEADIACLDVADAKETAEVMKATLLPKLTAETVPATMWLFAGVLLEKIASAEQVIAAKTRLGRHALESITKRFDNQSSRNLKKIESLHVYATAEEIVWLAVVTPVSLEIRESLKAFIDTCITAARAKNGSACNLFYIIDLVLKFADEKTKREAVLLICQDYSNLGKYIPSFAELFEEKIMAGYVSPLFAKIMGRLTDDTKRALQEDVAYFAKLSACGIESVNTKKLCIDQRIQACIENLKAFRPYPDMVEDVNFVLSLQASYPELAASQLNKVLEEVQKCPVNDNGKQKGSFATLIPYINIEELKIREQVIGMNDNVFEQHVIKLRKHFINIMLNGNDAQRATVAKAVSQFVARFIQYKNMDVSDQSSSVPCTTRFALAVVQSFATETEKAGALAASGDYSKRLDAYRTLSKSAVDIAAANNDSYNPHSTLPDTPSSKSKHQQVPGPSSPPSLLN